MKHLAFGFADRDGLRQYRNVQPVGPIVRGRCRALQIHPRSTFCRQLCPALSHSTTNADSALSTRRLPLRGGERRIG